MTIHEPFAGPIGPSMAEFSDEYMTYVEANLTEDLKLVPDRMLAILRSMRGLMHPEISEALGISHITIAQPSMIN
jgi:hypothetical protein